MASRLNNQFIYSPDPNLVFLDGSFAIGANGAVSSSTATFNGPAAPGTSGVVGRGVTRAFNQGAGQFALQLSDNYFRFVDAQFVLVSPTSATGSTTDGSFLVGKPYKIVWPSTSTNWVNAGVPANITPQIGTCFVATTGASNGPSGSSGATAAGNGVAVPILNTGIAQVELLPNPNMQLNSNSSILGQGGYVNFQTLAGATSAYLPCVPTSGTVIRFNLMLRNSSLAMTNETSTNY